MSQENTETAGGTRFASGKPGMWWAVPLYGLRLVAKVTEYGGDKYAPLDWREGQSFSTLTDCFFRHALDMVYWGPLSRDEESGLLNAAHAAWNLLAMLTFVATGEAEDLDDVSPWHGVITEDLRAARDLYADGHPGSVMEIAAELARSRRAADVAVREADVGPDQTAIRYVPGGPLDHPDTLVDEEMRRMGVDEDFAITEEELVRLAESIRERSSVGSAFSPVFERSVVDPLDGALAKTVGPGLTEGERYTMETALSMLTGCDDGHATGLSDVELVDALERAEGRYEEMPGGVVETPFTASDLRTIVDDAMEAAVDPLPTNPLVEDLQNMGYHFEEGQVEGELRVDGSATNPDPSWEAVGKMVSKAVSDLNQLPDRPYQAVRVGRDRIRAI